MTRGYTEYDVTFPSNKEDDNNAYVNDVDISQKLIDAYEKYRNSSGFIYRDYMYYNMSPDNTNNGVLQRNVKERLYAFRVEPSAIMSISDDFTNSNKDPQLYETPSKQKREFTYEELCDAIWKEGNFEFRLISNIAPLENILWWHRIIDRRGFRLNGFINHYPDFIIRTTNGNIILVEAKGEQLKNDDSKSKLFLGKKWDMMCGPEFKYYMVFERKEMEIPGSYTMDKFIEILKNL